MKLDLEALFRAGAAHPSGWRRMPAVAGEAMIATSHPLATAAGLAAFGEGGNAVDAALAAAAVLTVAEPTDNGVGGDAFALVWHDGRLHGLNGSGRSPRVLDEIRVDDTGPRSVTVPGAVRAWGDLAERFGRLGLDRALSRAAELATHGVACYGTDRRQVGSGATRPRSPPRGSGGRFVIPDLAETLARLAADGPDAFYRGAGRGGDRRRLVAGRAGPRRSPLGVGRAASLRLSRRRGLRAAPERAGGGRPDRARPVRRARAGPPLAARGDEARPGRRLRARGRRPVAERAARPRHLAGRRSLVDPARALDPTPSVLPTGGTTYLCAVDADGTAISLIQSVYGTFGSGVVAPGTGIVLQNRAAGFVEDAAHPNRLAPGRRPFHTIIPGMLLEGGELLGPFGVMGGAMQPQGHFQVVLRLVDHGDDPQAALDAPRWRVGAGRAVELEPGLWHTEEALAALGHDVRRATVQHPFGVGQAILRIGDALVGGSDGRGDGFAAGR